MKLGQICYWYTDKAKGYETRPKYHVFLTYVSAPHDAFAFLFINKTDYGNDYRIWKKDYDFLTLDFSFVDTQDILLYKHSELTAFAPKACGQLSKSHMVELFNALQKSERMTGYNIKLACEALKGAFALP
ncbi:MAG: hypothetical protein J0H11_05675 [Rhizobiales bacterium]|nr:hypothetical protein [Hyphomicrobiales bacterium]